MEEHGGMLDDDACGAGHSGAGRSWQVSSGELSPTILFYNARVDLPGRPAWPCTCHRRARIQFLANSFNVSRSLQPNVTYGFPNLLASAS